MIERDPWYEVQPDEITVDDVRVQIFVFST
jgi:hypothetical protein